jgi:hypothetical protein
MDFLLSEMVIASNKVSSSIFLFYEQVNQQELLILVSEFGALHLQVQIRFAQVNQEFRISDQYFDYIFHKFIHWKCPLGGLIGSAW